MGDCGHYRDRANQYCVQFFAWAIGGDGGRQLQRRKRVSGWDLSYRQWKQSYRYGFLYDRLDTW